MEVVKQTTRALPASVIAEDKALEERASASAVELCKLRWHWTLDESNPNRVAIREYARQVGPNEGIIRRDAHAFEDYSAAAGGRTIDLARERAKMTAETQAATEAVAKYRKVGFRTASREYRNEVAQIRDTARQIAEDQGTSTIDEIPGVAEFTAGSRETRREQDTERRARTPLRILETEAAWTRAYRYFLKGVQAIEGVELNAEERALLRETADNFKRLLVITDRALADRYDRTWVNDLRIIEGGKAS